MQVLANATIAKVAAETGGYDLIEDGALAIAGDRIAWVGAGAGSAGGASPARRAATSAGGSSPRG